MKHRLEASGIRKSFRTRRILSDVFLKVETGDVIGIIGRNGQGKSTLMKIVYGTLNSEKTVHIDGRLQQQAFQNPSLIRYLPQFNFLPNNLSIGRIFNDFEVDTHSFFNLFPELQAHERTKMGTLSGGWTRVVELYAILCSKSQFVLLDEPFTHISPVQVETIKKVIEAERKNKGVLLTDHLVYDLLDVSTELFCLNDGFLKRVKCTEDVARLGYKIEV